MSAAKKISVEDYLTGELVSPIKHEYLGGVVYAMARATCTIPSPRMCWLLSALVYTAGLAGR